VVLRLVGRAWNAAIVVLGVVTATFFMMRWTDGDPATIIALGKYGTQLISADVVERLAEEEGLNQPIHVQYWRWLSSLARGDLGTSLRSGRPVASEIAGRFPYTLLLAVLSVGVSALIAVPVGIYAGYHRDGVLDRLTRTLAGFTVSIPNYYVAILLILLFAVKLAVLPGYGFSGPQHLILPVAVLVLSKIGYTIRMTRSAVIDILSKDFVQYAEARGLARRRILSVHVLRNAAIPIITYLSLQFLMAIEGSVIVETIFAWPGVGQLLRDAIFGRDFTVIQGLVLFIGIVVTMVNLLTDTLYLFVNQRLAAGGNGQ
jgi:peptide/nickel transport system permease protein